MAFWWRSLQKKKKKYNKPANNIQRDVEPDMFYVFNHKNFSPEENLHKTLNVRKLQSDLTGNINWFIK